MLVDRGGCLTGGASAGCLGCFTCYFGAGCISAHTNVLLAFESQLCMLSSIMPLHKLIKKKIIISHIISRINSAFFLECHIIGNIFFDFACVLVSFCLAASVVAMTC
jgi:hypothetical protein